MSDGGNLRARHTHGERLHFTEAEALRGCPECAAPVGLHVMKRFGPPGSASYPVVRGGEGLVRLTGAPRG